MKCKYCGNNLTIDDEKCPFCGQDNTYAVKHRSQMHYFKKIFTKTEKEVMEKSRRFNLFTVQITVIAVLIALIVTVLLLYANEWEIRQALYQRDIKKNLKQYETMMKQYEAAGDYWELGRYYERKHLSVDRHFDEYENVAQVCSSYANSYNIIMQLVIMEDTEFYSHEEKVEYLASTLNYMYKGMKKESFSKEECFSEKHVATMEDIKKEAGYMLITYCHLSKEDVEKFPTLSEARKQIMLEEGLGLGN